MVPLSAKDRIECVVAAEASGNPEGKKKICILHVTSAFVDS